MIDVHDQLDELYQAQLELMNEARRALGGVGEARDRLTREAAQLADEAQRVVAECDRVTAAGDAHAARALLEQQHELLDRMETANVGLRTVQDFETAFSRQIRALQQAVDTLRTTKESAKAEIALGRAERMKDRASDT